MIKVNVSLELTDDQNVETLMHDLLKYQIEPLMIEGKIENYDWEIQ